MSTMHNTPGTAPVATQGHAPRDRRLTTETKASYKTTEFAFYILAVIGVLIASLVVDGSPADFGAQEAWLYVTLLTIGYMLSRGIAKSGSREPYDDATNANSGHDRYDRG